MSTQTLSLSLPTTLPPGNHKVIFKVYEVCFAYELICIICPYASPYKQYHIICLPLSDFFSLSTIISRSIRACCKWQHFILFGSFWCCLHLSMPTPLKFSFQFLIWHSSQWWTVAAESTCTRTLLSTVAFAHFSCVHRGTSASGVCFCGHMFSDVVLLALFLGEWQPDILPSHLLQPLPGIYFVFFIPL